MYSEPFCEIRLTGCNRVSTGTGSLLLLKIELPVTIRPPDLQESLTHITCTTPNIGSQTSTRAMLPACVR
jgi:hypothetical protein